MREGGFSTPLCHYAIILRPKNPTNDILNGTTKTYLVGVQQLEIQMNQMWLSRLLFPDYCPLSPTEQSPTAAQSVAGVLCMRNETAHAQYTKEPKGGG